MAEPISGYKTAQGEFYETSEEAEYQEKKQYLQHEAHRAIEIEDPNSLVKFIEKNHELVAAFCATVYEKVAASQTKDSLDVLEEMNKGVSLDGEIDPLTEPETEDETTSDSSGA